MELPAGSEDPFDNLTDSTVPSGRIRHEMNPRQHLRVGVCRCGCKAGAFERRQVLDVIPDKRDLFR